MKAGITFFLLLSFLVSYGQKASVGGFSVMPGIPAKGATAAKGYATAGTRSYVIGTQNGNFPDMGEHIPGGMGGVWAPPYKLADGYWASITDDKDGRAVQLTKADVFTNLPYGTLFRYNDQLPGINITRLQFCPDGLPGVLVKYTISNNRDRLKHLKFTFTVKSNLRPVWFSDTLNREYPDNIRSDAGASFLLVKDSQQPYYLAVNSLPAPFKQIHGKPQFIPEPTKADGAYDNLVYNVTVKPHANTTITLSLAGVMEGAGKSLTIAKQMVVGNKALLTDKLNYMNNISNTSEISIPDKQLQLVYNWVKLNTEWLKRTVPGIGTGLTAGYMEYPWWFGCDNTYALQGLMATGDFSLAKQTLNLLYQKSKATNNNGRIVHEITTSGKVVNKGNTQETAHFIMCVGTYLKWTGDKDFVAQVYPYMKQGINWLLGTMDTNHDMFPEGYGITEITGLNAELIDVSVYTQQALETMYTIAKIMGDDNAANGYKATSVKLKSKINREFYDKAASSYCDFYGTKQQALQALNGALRQLKTEEPNDKDELYNQQEAYYNKLKINIAGLGDSSRGWLTNKNWVINTPMECGIAPYDTAIAALDEIKKFNCGKYGPFLAAAEGRKMMTIATGVQAVAECRYGRIDSALWYMHRICATFGMVLPGSISEMMPDYGCFTQAWTNYGIEVPLVNYIFGVTPDALNKSVTLNPVMPSGWNYMSLKHLKAGNNDISMQIKRAAGRTVYHIEQTQPLWKLKVCAKGFKRYRLNGKLLPVIGDQIVLNGRRNNLIVE